MRRRGGFALLSVLWLTVALATLATAALAPLVVSRHAAENRPQLARARWAARACIELARARIADGGWAIREDSVALGALVWCRLDSMRPDERVNPNVADSVGLSAVLSDERQVASLLDWTDADTEPRPGGAEASWYAARGRQGPRNAPLAAVEEIRLIRGFEQYDAEDIRATFTTSGDGSVSPNRAPEWALRSITGVPSDLAVRLQPIPMSERHFRSADELSALLGLDPSVPEFREMARRLSFADAQTIVRATGSVDIGRAVLVSTMVATLQETRGRVQIVRLQSQ